ncbi:LLM class F420-dependent oxidoreductase [uncultured Novosphingobium sp.]|uniref:LLM class F420-dependent oxidoreductase n=1 Tax=uncultured Novosphingobium sp. TaxID=292277 RepID=UPI002586D8BF|nr:LLM class F420-dependent oxidoreductase [uncultured Novosphingobium sp.]
MQIHIVMPHGGPLASPEMIRDFAQTVEESGFHGLGFFDHLALPRAVESEYNLGAKPTGIPEDNLKKTLTPLYECLTVMGYVAGLTKRVRLSTGILVLPLRNPIYNARQIATLDAMSGGRVDLGIGVGWLEEEATAMQMPWDERGARTDEHIAVLRTLWESDDSYVSYKGRFYEFEEIDPKPHSLQRPLPILIGGHAPVARRRAGRVGNGWITSKLDPEAQASGMEDTRAAAVAAGRDPDALQWFTSIDVRFEHGAIKAPEKVFETLRAYQALGVGQVSLNAMARERADMFTLVQWLAKEILPQFGDAEIAA